ncbi:unnamed protein product [Ectocarpus sp. CCAP 1310/34]|nr:unnamed protein product [Ectocarpus sp. CCAP 1310/34]
MSFPMMASYATLFGLWTLTQFVLVPVPVNLIVTSTLILYIGSHRSLRLRDKTSVEACESETLSKEAAMKAPVVGSMVLVTIYFLFKYVDAKIVNMLLLAYFTFIGSFALAATVDPVLVQIFGTTDAKRHGTKFELPLIGEVDLTFTATELVSFVIGVAFAAAYAKTRHWALNNIFGMTFCVQAMERVSLGSVKVAGILLVGLFIYDITWVYGGPVMESVAKSVQGPIKILFVSAWANPDADPPVKLTTSLLGLGDIVVPGLFSALLIRFDAVRANADPSHAEHGSFPKPYFHACLVAYIGGLAATVTVMFYFKAAQPALFYLVPACLGATGMTALWRREVKALVAYDEDTEEVDGEEHDAADKKDK